MMNAATDPGYFLFKPLFAYLSGSCDVIGFRDNTRTSKTKLRWNPVWLTVIVLWKWHTQVL